MGTVFLIDHISQSHSLRMRAESCILLIEHALKDFLAFGLFYQP